MSQRWESPVAKHWPPATAQPLTVETAARLAPVLKALGDPVRLRLLSMIAAGTEIAECDLAAAFDLADPAISHHLQILRDVGLVGCERRAGRIHHRIHPAAMARVSLLLQSVGNA